MAETTDDRLISLANYDQQAFHFHDVSIDQR